MSPTETKPVTTPAIDDDFGAGSAALIGIINELTPMPRGQRLRVIACAAIFFGFPDLGEAIAQAGREEDRGR